ncbi:glycoside hydrolase family 26 protein [Pedobacter psychroterrae]|uniref:Glycoside hydrolase n=1 Tax=Pedobacter psychroterrae TaxID=2530453 RepID=A0A4R0NKS6_9SPHI|nr:glycosyl hydrolase [Pedobacter psychroterrae]TCD01341.1 glycoside hydrolase [Pedobacter psychroterrae]
MKRNYFFYLLVLISLPAFAQKKAASRHAAEKHPELHTRFKTLNYLYKISGKATAFGIHNREPNEKPATWTNEIFKTTGKYPALWSGDFLFQAENIAARQTMINEAVTQWKKGSMINIMWHACNPALEQPCGWDKKGVLSKLSDEQWNELLTDGSKINSRWKAMMDEIAVYLQQLEHKGVEVMFRPLHEMNQGVFWWGGRPGERGTRKLYQITHDYLTKTKGLSNLIWVWNIQDFGTLESDAVSYNPGDKYWDIATLDIYDDKTGFSREKYNIMVNVAKGKPIAIGECQKYPTAEKLQIQNKWTFFMGWSELVYKYNTNEEIIKLMSAPNVLSLDELKGF